MSKIYKVEVQITHCEGGQTYACEATSKEEALDIFKSGNFECVSEETDIMATSEITLEDIYEDDNMESDLIQDVMEREKQKLKDKIEVLKNKLCEIGTLLEENLSLLREDQTIFHLTKEVLDKCKNDSCSSTESEGKKFGNN